MVSRCNGLGNQLSGNTRFDESEHMYRLGVNFAADPRASDFGIRVDRIARNRMAAAPAMY